MLPLDFDWPMVRSFYHNHNQHRELYGSRSIARPNLVYPLDRILEQHIGGVTCRRVGRITQHSPRLNVHLSPATKSHQASTSSTVWSAGRSLTLGTYFAPKTKSCIGQGQTVSNRF